MRAVEYVEGGGRLLAIVVKADFDERWTVPLTDESLSLQMSVMVKWRVREAQLTPISRPLQWIRGEIQA